MGNFRQPVRAVPSAKMGAKYSSLRAVGRKHGVDHGGIGGTRPPRILEWGTLMQIASPRFCHIVKFRAPNCLHCNAVKCSV